MKPILFSFAALTVLTMTLNSWADNETPSVGIPAKDSTKIKTSAPAPKSAKKGKAKKKPTSGSLTQAQANAAQAKASAPLEETAKSLDGHLNEEITYSYTLSFDQTPKISTSATGCAADKENPEIANIAQKILALFLDEGQKPKPISGTFNQKIDNQFPGLLSMDQPFKATRKGMIDRNGLHLSVVVKETSSKNAAELHHWVDLQTQFGKALPAKSPKNGTYEVSAAKVTLAIDLKEGESEADKPVCMKTLDYGKGKLILSAAQNVKIAATTPVKPETPEEKPKDQTPGVTPPTTTDKPDVVVASSPAATPNADDHAIKSSACSAGGPAAWMFTAQILF